MYYNKDEIKKSLTLDQIFNLLIEFQGNPTYSGEIIISDTIDHNEPLQGSHKLYYYPNSGEGGLFVSYTEGSTFDIFELVQKVASIQWHKNLSVGEAIRWIAVRYGISGTLETDITDNRLEDWDYLTAYAKIQEININKKNEIVLKEYDDKILNNFNYSLKLIPWLKDNISQEAITKARIGYYLGGDQITIPHYDKDNRLIGIRGRTMRLEEAEIYGKYRPLKINQILYTHPLGLNLFNLNNAKDNIKLFQKAIIAESEKATLQYATFFGWENNICVASCGSSISDYQINLLIESGAKEIIIMPDRQFQEKGDKEFQALTKKLEKLNKKFSSEVNMSFIFDKQLVLPYKANPLDVGKDIFLELFKERVTL